MEESPAWLEEEDQQQRQSTKWAWEEHQVQGVEEDFEIMEGDVEPSTPPSTQIDTTTPTSWLQTDDVGSSSGK